MADNPKRRGGPRARASKPTDAMQQIFKLGEFQQSFDMEAFESLIRGQGVKVIHMRAIPDPSGMASIGDVHAVQSKRQSSDGFIYKEVGELTLWFSQNTSDWNVEVEGMTKHDVAIVTSQLWYENCPDKEVLLAPWDRFYLKDIEVRVIAFQYVEANTTGVDKLQYPATCVEHLIDADGKEYKEGTHFEITKEGFIKWISQDRPGFNEKLGRGTVYSIRYRYTPYFIVARMLHEIRVSQVTDPETFNRKLQRTPFQALVIREHVLSDQNRDPNQHIMDQRFQGAPPVGGVTGPNDSGPDGGML
jgi:hypothetical protein